MRIDEDEQAIRIRKLRKAMKYTAEDYKMDWNVAVAMAQIMAALGETEWRHYILEDCMMRIQAYLDNNPDARPFDV